MRTDSVAAFMAAHATGQLGWTALPRLAVWLCVPALVSGAAAAANLLGKFLFSPTDALRLACVRAAMGIQLVFAFPSFVLTPVAALLVLIISIRRKWSLRVVIALWVLVILSAAIMSPAFEVTIRDLMSLGGRR